MSKGFTLILITLIIGTTFVNAQSAQPARSAQSAQSDPEFGDGLLNVVREHKQLYDMSCIPSSVEMVLKFNKKVKPGYYDLQEAWKNKADGTFQYFDGKTLYGIKFAARFNQPRGDGFPIDSLFGTIDNELRAGRKVIISLPSGGGMWHMYVIDHATPDGEYFAYSRTVNFDNMLASPNVKEVVRSVKGTDILTYTVVN